MATYDIATNANSDVEVYIYKPKEEIMYRVVVLEPVVWTTEHSGSAGKLEFTVVKCGDLSFQEGSIVIFKYKGKEIFRGAIFVKQRDKEHHIACTAYDSLRYFKNEVNPRVLNLHKGSTTTKILEWLCSTKTNSFTKGWFEDSKINVVWNETEPKTMFDIIAEVEDQTRINDPKHTIYTLYDDCGKLYYKSIDHKDMKLDLLIDKTALETFSYTSSIDDETYNRVLLYWGDDEGSTKTTKKTTNEKRNSAGNLDPIEDPENVENWGVLQLTKKIDSSVANPEDYAKKLLETYNKKSRNCSLQGVLGDVRARAGTSVLIDLDLGDIAPKKYAFVTKARHTFENKFHTMDLDVDLKIIERGAV